jgi:2-dehydropantoate 2-reductase
MPRILVIGAGAVGAYFGARLQQRGCDVTFVARGEHLDALQRDGLDIRSIDGDVRLAVRAESRAPASPVDLVLIAVKAWQTEAALDAAAPAIGPESFVWSLQNGIDNEDRIAARVGADRTVGGVAFIGAERTAPGRIDHTAAGQATMGAWTTRYADRLHGWAQRLDQPPLLRLAWAEDIRSTLWHKLMWNAAFNTTTALAGVTARQILADPAGRELVRAAMVEVRSVAEASGAVLPPDAEDAYITRTWDGGEVRTSMLVDREHKRPLEHDAISGALVRRADELGIDVPVQRALFAMLDAWDRHARQG